MLVQVWVCRSDVGQAKLLEMVTYLWGGFSSFQTLLRFRQDL